MASRKRRRSAGRRAAAAAKGGRASAERPVVQPERRSTRLRVLAGVVVVAVAALVGVGIYLSTSSSPARGTARPASFTHAQYVHMFALAKVGHMSIGAISAWPPPYQTYHDQYGQRCFEWNDVGHALDNLCFKPNGELALKVEE